MPKISVVYSNILYKKGCVLTEEYPSRPIVAWITKRSYSECYSIMYEGIMNGECTPKRYLLTVTGESND